MTTRSSLMARMGNVTVGLAVVSTAAIMGCSASSTEASAAGDGQAIRDVSRREALDDFNEIVASFRSMYGAMQWKEARYHFNYDTLVNSFRSRISNATDDAEVAALFQEFICTFRDPHVSLSTELYADSAKKQTLPLLVGPYEKSYLVYAVGAALTAQGVVRGDELVSVDGVTPQDFVTGMYKYAGTANPLTAKAFVSLYVTQRPYWTPAKYAPKSANATMVLKNAAGKTYTVTAPWKEAARLLPPTQAAPAAGQSAPTAGIGKDHVMLRSEVSMPAIQAELTEFGARVPFYMSAQTQAALGITAEVQPSAAALAKYNLAAADAAVVNYYATTYVSGGKNVLLVRLPDYEPQDANGNDNSTNALSYLRALLDDQQGKADVLVIDETHNPGGSVDFAKGVFSLLINKTSNSYVQKQHADRQWIQTYATYGSELSGSTDKDTAAYGAILTGYAHEVDTAYSAKKTLSAPIPFFDPTPTIDPDAAFHWSKPFVMLTDELSVSCADLVPSLVKANKAGLLFGETTMGGGGNVEAVATLTNTQGVLSMSRGMGTPYDPTGKYPSASFIEDNGVKPDVKFDHTVADFRAGYVGYAQAFTKAAVGQVPVATPPVTMP